jgi:CheY-like chemotaxis protein
VPPVRVVVVDDSADVRLLLRAIPDDAGDLKLVLCSALVDDEVRERAAAAGIAACVRKDDMDEIPRLALSVARGSAP